ncbi:MAG: AsmA family protein [Saprospiraceae bacterium]|nr:AsmA family protein [Saprospiraceae bacterium]
MRKLLKWLAGAILLIVLLLVLAPYLFKGRLVEAAKQGLNDNLRAKSDFRDVSLSFFRSFPHLQITLSDLTIDGIDDFEGVPLFHAKSVSASVDFWSVISKTEPIKIVSLSADAPLINILTLTDGQANYDITVASEEESTASEGSIQFQLDHYDLNDGTLRYEDQTMPMQFVLEQFDHSGEGNFADMVFDLKTSTEARWLSISYDGVTYLDSLKAKLDAVISMNLDEYRYTLKDNQLLLNDLELNAEGFIDLNDDDIELDLGITAPKSDFRHLLSILPGAYTEGFQQAEIKGSFDLENRIWGRYSEEHYPAFTLKTTISDGSVKYSDLPVGISNINLDLVIDKPDGALDLMKILLSKLALQIGPQPINGRLAISTPMSDPNVEGALRGTLNLADLAKAYPMQDMQTLEGKIDADIKFKARMSQIDNKSMTRC